jgi:hypothetical protein
VRIGAVVAIALGCAAGPAGAADVTFTGTLSGVCTLAVPTPGTLALNADGTKLGSNQTGGLPATVTILSVGTNTVTVSAPSWVSTPAGYAPSGELLEVSYLGLGGLSLVNQALTDQETDFVVNTLPLTALTVNAQATNANGFADGTYEMKVVVTCAP